MSQQLTIKVSEVTYLSALAVLGSDVWEMLRVGGCHAQPAMTSGAIHACTDCGKADYYVGRCADCAFEAMMGIEEVQEAEQGPKVRFYDEACVGDDLCSCLDCCIPF